MREAGEVKRGARAAWRGAPTGRRSWYTGKMSKPWEISADDIATWADGVGSPERLHALVRRLLLATVPLAHLEIRTGVGVWHAGPDAVVVAREEGPYWPRGESFWELSTRADVSTKLKEDDAKGWPVGANPLVSAYVAVTARRASPKMKETWLNARRAEGQWADVRFLDADDLAGWLDVAPAVRCWFAETELGRPTGDLRTVDEFLREFVNRTPRPLPITVALTGKQRRRAANELLQELINRDDRLQRRSARDRETAVAPPLRIAAETVDEALVFVAAMLAQAGNPEAESLKARAVIVESPEAFRFCLQAQSKEPLLLLPRFEGVQPAQAAGHRVHVVVSTASSERLPPGAGRVLDVIPFKPLARALDEAGFEDTERLSRESGGRLAKLQRLLGYVELPSWANGSVAADLLALLLAGAWEPSRSRDRDILRQLGANPADAERVCVRLSLGQDPAFEAEEDRSRVKVWRWVAPRDAFRSLARNLTDSDLNKFFEVACEVLTPPPCSPDEESSDTYVRASLHVDRQLAACSGAIFRGIASTIAWLSVEDEALTPTHRAGQGRGRAEGLVQRLLEPEARAWAFLSSVLGELAEAAPRVFLDQLGKSLDRGKEWIALSSDLLWALKTLAWDRSLLVRVTEALARLVPYDDLSDNYRPRPINSLQEVLSIAIPQSRSTARERIAALRNLFHKHNDVAWKVCVDLLQTLSSFSVMSPSPRPKYWRETPPDDLGAPSDEQTEQVQEMVTLVLDHAGQSPDRWASLVFIKVGYLKPRVLDALDAARPGIVDPEATIWNALRQELGKFIEDRDEDESPGDTQELEESGAYRARLDKLYEHFRPLDDFVLEYAWLFTHDPSLPKVAPGGWEGAQIKLEELRRDAVEALRERPDRREILGRFAARVEVPGMLGQTLARASWADEIEEIVLAELAAPNLGRALPCFLALRSDSRGWDWLEHLIRTLVSRNQVDQAVETLVLFQNDVRPWRLVETLGEPICTGYWKKLTPLWFGALSAADYERGIGRLLDMGRPKAALEAARQGLAKGMVESSTILRLLEALAMMDASARAERVSLVNASIEGDIEQLFVALDRDPMVDSEEVLRLEILHAKSLTNILRSRAMRRGARRFYEKISTSPDYFLDVFRRLQRSPEKADPGATSPEQENSTYLERNHLITLLNHWSGYPGKGLPEAEREAALSRWCTEVFHGVTEQDLLTQDVDQVAHILARVEPPEDGHWPCLTARRLIESGKYPDMRERLDLAKSNGRGWVSRSLGEGGVQEIEIAARYQAGADALRATYPSTAAMLEKMADSHRWDADGLEPEARRERIAYDEDEPSSRTAHTTASAPSATTHGAPVSSLELHGVGPSRYLKMDLAPRLTILTGDNSLGKTLFLDLFWWATTGAWSEGRQALPGDPGTEPRILVQANGGVAAQSRYVTAEHRWLLPEKRPQPDTLVVYARVDGGFSVWDPIRNAPPVEPDDLDLTAGYVFSPKTLWEQLAIENEKTRKPVVVCKGLIEDLSDWPARRKETFALFREVLAGLSPDGEPMSLGEPRQISKQDAIDYPTLVMPYATVPIPYVSAAAKRILGLAYALVWAWDGHRRAAAIAERAPVKRVMLLIDEMEAHLHPKWQRVILPALFRVVEKLLEEVAVQVVVTTHAPLVLASVETFFDTAQDRLFNFRLAGREVTVEEIPWAKQGDATNWLVSESFGLPQARSREAERAIAAAEAFMRGAVTPPDLDTSEKIHAELLRVLGGHDDFWPRWLVDTGRVK